MLTKKISLMAVTAIITCTACSKQIENTPDASGDQKLTAKKAKFSVVVSTIAGKKGDRGNAQDGNGPDARFWNPTKMVFDNRDSMLYVADGSVIRRVDRQNNVTTYIPLGGIGSSYNEILDMDIAPGASGGTLYIVTKENDLWKITPNGNTGKATNIVNRVYGGNAVGRLNSGDHFDLASGLATGKNGEIYFYNTAWATMHRITITSGASKKITGVVERFAGKPFQQRGRDGNGWPFLDGQGEAATIGPRSGDITADGNGNIYVADYDFELVRKITPAGLVSSLFKFSTSAGQNIDGPVATAQAWRVTNVTANQSGSYVFFTSTGLRVVRPGKDVTTLVTGSSYGDGPGNTAGLGDIGGLATTADGKTVYVAEPSNKVIRKVVLQ